MPQSFLIRRVIKNPPVDYFEAPIQTAIPGEDETANTSYRLVQSSFIDSIDRYIAHHELLVKKIGRAHGRMFNFYYEPYDFPFYYDNKRNLIYIGTNKEVAKSFLEHIGREKDWEAVPIDYEAMTPFLPPITGAWFCELKLQYVSSAGYFGRHVDRSDEFKKAAKNGHISVLYINVPWPDNNSPDFRVGITSKGSIVIAQKFELEEHQLELVSHVYDTYIAPTLGVQIK